MHEICTFIGEPYSPLMLTMQDAELFREEGGNSSYGRRPPGVISTSSIGKFRNVLTRRQISYMERVAGRDMTSFGYTLDDIDLSAGEKSLFYLYDAPVNTLRATVWRAREAYSDRKGRQVPSYRIVPGIDTAATA